MVDGRKKRGNRKKSKRNAISSSAARSNLTPEYLQTALKRIAELLSTLYLPPKATHLVQACSDIQALAEESTIEALQTAETQNLIGKSICECAGHPAVRDERVQVAIAKLASGLTEWHASNIGDSLSYYCSMSENYEQVLSVSDFVKLEACMIGIASVAQSSMQSKESRSLVASKIPVLVHAVAAAQFSSLAAGQTPAGNSCSDTAPTSTSESDFSSVSKLNLHTSRTPSRLFSVRRRAADALIALVNVSPFSLTPHWNLFLPEHDGIASSSENRYQETFASILLFDRSTEIRVLAVDCMLALLSGARRFLPNAGAERRIPSKTGPVREKAFVSSSSRVSNVSSVLYGVISSAFRRENSPQVSAKLAKMAAELFQNVPAPNVSPGRVETLMQSLLDVALDTEYFDRTTQIGALAALSFAVTSSGSHLSNTVLQSVIDVVLLTLQNRQDTERPAYAEALMALMGVASIWSQAVESSWENLCGHLRKFVAGTDDVLCLQVARLIECIFSDCLNNITNGVFNSSNGRGIRDVEQSLCWMSALYNDFVVCLSRHSFHSVRSSALTSAEYLLRICEYIENLDGFDVRKDSSRASNLLLEHAVIDDDLSVACVAVRGLAVVPNKVVGFEQYASLFNKIFDQLKSSESPVYRTRCVWTLASFIEKLDLRSEHLKERQEIIQKCFDLSVQRLSHAVTNEHQSDNDELSAEPELIGYVHILKVCLHKFCQKPFFNFPPNDIWNPVWRILCALVSGHRTSVKLQWNACRALGDILASCIAAHFVLPEMRRKQVRETFLHCLNSRFNIKVQAASIKAVRETWSILSVDQNDLLQLLLAIAECSQRTQELQKGPNGPVQRKQLEVLRDDISAIVHDVLSILRPSEVSLSVLTSTSCDNLGVLFDGISKHLAFSDYIFNYNQGEGPAYPANSLSVANDVAYTLDSLPRSSKRALSSAVSLVEVWAEHACLSESRKLSLMKLCSYLRSFPSLWSHV